MRLHTGSKPYKCPHCPAMFRAPNSRIHHIATHFADPSNTRTSKRKSTRAAKSKTNYLRWFLVIRVWSLSSQNDLTEPQLWTSVSF